MNVNHSSETLRKYITYSNMTALKIFRRPAYTLPAIFKHQGHRLIPSGIFTIFQNQILWREETIGPCPCPRWGHPWRLNTFITKIIIITDPLLFCRFGSSETKLSSEKIKC